MKKRYNVFYFISIVGLNMCIVDFFITSERDSSPTASITIVLCAILYPHYQLCKLADDVIKRLLEQPMVTFLT